MSESTVNAYWTRTDESCVEIESSVGSVRGDSRCATFPAGPRNGSGTDTSRISRWRHLPSSAAFCRRASRKGGVLIASPDFAEAKTALRRRLRVLYASMRSRAGSIPEGLLSRETSSVFSGDTRRVGESKGNALLLNAPAPCNISTRSIRRVGFHDTERERELTVAYVELAGNSDKNIITIHTNITAHP